MRKGWTSLCPSPCSLHLRVTLHLQRKVDAHKGIDFLLFVFLLICGSFHVPCLSSQTCKCSLCAPPSDQTQNKSKLMWKEWSELVCSLIKNRSSFPLAVSCTDMLGRANQEPTHQLISAVMKSEFSEYVPCPHYVATTCVLKMCLAWLTRFLSIKWFGWVMVLSIPFCCFLSCFYI